jgi:hypothetical protein
MQLLAVEECYQLTEKIYEKLGGQKVVEQIKGYLVYLNRFHSYSIF